MTCTANLTVVLVGVMITVGSASADTIVQEGSLNGWAGEPMTFDCVVDQFDTQDGTRQLNFVQIDLLTSTIGGGMTQDGAAPPTHIYAQLDANYSFEGAPLADTQALIDTMISHDGPSHPFTVFDTDTAQVIIDRAADMAAWTGTGQIAMEAWVQFTVWEDPPDSTGFSAGGSVQYTVTYDYELVDVAGDFDGDGDVDAADLAILLGAWGPCPGDACPADLNQDGDVNATDLAILLGNWG